MLAKSLANVIDARARETPGAAAFLGGESPFSWADYAERSDRLAGALAARGLQPGDRVGVVLPDGPGVHAAFVGAEKAGLVVVGIGARAGRDEIRHLLRVTGARALLSPSVHRDVDMAALCAELRDRGLPLRHHLRVTGELEDWEPAGPRASATLPERRLAPDDLFLLNSTSGTTGLPKCVTHHQARWFYFHELACASGELSRRDVFMSVLPAPYGFGIWTAHVTPALLGPPTVLMPRFDPEQAWALIERHRVTVLAAVSTQFIMMLNARGMRERDVSSLRALYTGGEAVPYERAAEFEERTGARVLQFYGSNETGALSRTSMRDSRDVRLRTAGRVIPGMQVRLFDDDGADVSKSGVGQPGCRGPATSRGYWNDEDANRKLYTRDGWMLTGDIATIDADGVLRVIGRKADFIIRGGKNVSGAVVEEACGSHPAIVLAAAVPMPDPVFGERVCLYAELVSGAQLSLAELVKHLEDRGVSVESFPERLVVVDALPRSSGGKVAKQQLKDDIRRRLADEQER